MAGRLGIARAWAHRINKLFSKRNSLDLDNCICMGTQDKHIVAVIRKTILKAEFFGYRCTTLPVSVYTQAYPR